MARVQEPAVMVESNFTDAVFVSGLSGPTTMTFAPDGRLFVSEKDGKLRVIKNNQLLTTPFVTLAVDTDNERGLMGVAFDPNFTTNNYLYVYYTSTAGSIHNRLSRYTANGDVAVAGSELIMAELPTLEAANHNGGAVHFGADGKLYVAVGDNAVSNNAQSLSTPLGKLLRINADGTIPTDNPFYASTTGLNRSIWARGLRNPFTFDVQPGTGTIFINDVGNGGWEEINRGQAGANYGWPTTEGNFTGHPEFVAPFYTYPHGTGTSSGNCIAGGAFYNPPVSAFPAAYVGQYFFADFNNNWIRRINPTTGVSTLFATGADGPVDLDVGPDAALYYLARGSGQVSRIAYTASLPPGIVQHPANTLVSVGYNATFTVASTGEPPLSYQWQRNGVTISGATSNGYTLSNVQLSDNGARFRAVITNAIGSATSNEAVLTVTSNQPPIATITTPTSGATYTGGSTLSFAGTGTDNEDGTLPASSLTWSIVFHHDTHNHPAMAETTGITSGSWPIPNAGESAANVWYRVYLKVTDSIGLTHTTYRDVNPVSRPFTIATNPAGLQITLDGQPFTAPYTTTGVAGVLRSIGVSSPQPASNTYWAFSSWSDSGAQTHTITTPSAATTYTAQFVETTLPPCGSSLLTAVSATSLSDESGDTGALKAIDGNANTRWSSTFSDPQWIYVDLGATRHIGRVVLNWENASSKDYSIEVSNSTSGPWTPIYTDPVGNGGVDDIGNLNGTGRYVRMYGRSRNGVYGHSLWEMTVYGDTTPLCNSGGSPTPTCSDAIQNQGETGVDCGGPCAACSGGPAQLAISSSTSGAYQDPPSSSHDSSTTTRYTNDGNLATASITYTLSASASVSKVRLMMYNGASRTYPITIRVGSTLVFTGATTLNSGYLDIPFSAVTGNTVTITMTSANSSGSNWFSIYETQIFGTP